MQTGTHLVSGETILEIEPRAVVISGPSGKRRLLLDIPTASTDQFTATLPLDGFVATTRRSLHIAPVDAAEQLRANLDRLNQVLQASRVKLHVIADHGTKPLKP